MLDAVVEYLPSPTEVKAIEGEVHGGKRDVRQADDDAPFSALAFKIATDPFVGTLTFMRVYSGKLESGTAIYNSVKMKRSVLVEWCRCIPIAVKKIKEVLAGDIVAAIGLKDVTTEIRCVRKTEKLYLSEWNSRSQLFLWQLSQGHKRTKKKWEWR